ncbi:hypothetical protein GGI42DRAFT_320362 [Trichoderma sp. SZMC 28013]
MRSDDATWLMRRGRQSSLCAKSLPSRPMACCTALLLRSDTVSRVGDGPSSYRAAPLGIERLPLP